MNRLNLRLVTTTTTIFAAIVYAVCIAVHCSLLLPNLAAYTTPMLVATFPGFSWTPGGILLGLLEIMVYAAIGSALYVELYNFFATRLTTAKV
jgi:hypothetical protein